MKSKQQEPRQLERTRRPSTPTATQSKNTARQRTVRPYVPSLTQPQRPRSAQSRRVDERLWHEADHIATDRERKRHLRQLEELEECSFQPQLNGNSERMIEKDYRPVYERIEAIQHMKETKLAQARDQFLQQHAPFTPSISKRSERLAMRRSVSDVTERMAEDQQKAEGRHRSRRSRHDEELAEQFTAKPQINDKSRAILTHNDVYSRTDLTFAERQEILETQRQREIAAVRESLKVMQSAPKTTGETKDDLYRRLVDDARRRRQPQTNDRPDCTFTPSMNRKSAQRAATPLNELVSDSRAKAKREQLRQMRDRAEYEECSFKPKIGPRPRSASRVTRPHYSINDPDRLSREVQADLDRRRSREVEADLMRRERDMRECTFKPKITRGSRPKSPAPVDVKGLGRFMELRDLAARKNAPLPRSRSRSRSMGLPYTIPKPFRLSGTHPKAAELSDLARQASFDRQYGECTFRPDTLESTRSSTISRILRTDYSASYLDY
ncbi:pathogenesis-related genes transcriptional activator [Carpediemonas membranifera]|uniref:Pathogenesis-related genes transcriptional activator n=1 Tax=Carpediemonas membranifera TaxID=201153 RepID=A0A8J6ATE2_9EUKA|nr:pathogenesis-related genes transcriptional activator [Carpediemonas membranifera]|eukprot:KAG9391020.1 pathogenesis-related genes transcriptional activator [Carpediemonas membranifera]